MNAEVMLSKKEASYIKKLWGVIRWSLIRHKYLVPAFSLAQAAFAIAIIYGMALFLPEVNKENAIYLSSGALTLGIIAVGCVLAPQIVSEAKQNGIFAYQKTLPISRSSILLGDIIIWEIAALPGIIIGGAAAVIRFNVTLDISILSCLVFLLAQFTTICIGFCIAYWFPPNAMALVTQIIMIGGLLFSPITYPVERLPEWTAYIYQALPFVPISNLIRSTLFHLNSMSVYDVLVVIAWALITFMLSLFALSKKD